MDTAFFSYTQHIIVLVLNMLDMSDTCQHNPRKVILISVLLVFLPGSSIGQRSQLNCPNREDYSPCFCIQDNRGRVVACENVKTDVIRHVFHRQTPSSIPILSLTFSDLPADGIPADLLGNHRITEAIAMTCKSKEVPLKINLEAFRSSSNYTQELSIDSCNLDELDLSFLQGFQSVQRIWISLATHFESINWSTLPELPKLSTLGIRNLVGLKSVGNLPSLSHGLSTLNVKENCLLGDDGMNDILDWAVNNSKETLERLQIRENGLTRIPKQIPFFDRLSQLELTGNMFPVISQGSLMFSSIMSKISIDNCSVEVVEPDAIQGNFSIASLLIDLSNNKLAKLEELVYKPLLQQLTERNGFINISGNQLNCSEENICNLRWLILENRHLLEIFRRTGSCSNGTGIDYLSQVGGFNHCQNETSIEGSNSLTTGQLIPIVILLVIVAILGSLLTRSIYLNKKRQKEMRKIRLALLQGKPERMNPDLSIKEQVHLLPYDPKWEFPVDRLLLGKQLGAGNFGVVFEGKIISNSKDSRDNRARQVAVKMIKSQSDNTALASLISELKILIHLGSHLNVVNLIGASTRDIVLGDLLVILEFCAYGNLRSYLISNRHRFVNQLDENGKISVGLKNPQTSRTRRGTKQFESADVPSIDRNGYMVPAHHQSSLLQLQEEEQMMFNTHVLVDWSCQISRGMNHLASKMVIHGDLAARNILLADGNIVKISDFGLSREIRYANDNYQKKGEEALPVKWMAIESLTDRTFSTQSDVWSYGILLWELFSLGEMPYQDVTSIDVLIRKLKEGERLGKPKLAPNNIWKMMCDCWQCEPKIRPTFAHIDNCLSDI